MNKYLEALDDVAGLAYQHGCISAEGEIARDEHVALLQELVDSATPMKPVKREIYDSFIGRSHMVDMCPKCNNVVFEDESCSNNDCRQAIDWSKDYE